MTDSNRSEVHSSYRTKCTFIHRGSFQGTGVEEFEVQARSWDTVFFFSSFPTNRFLGSGCVASQADTIKEDSTLFFRGQLANFPIERTIDIAEEDLTALKRTVPLQESLGSTQIPFGCNRLHRQKINCNWDWKGSFFV